MGNDLFKDVIADPTFIDWLGIQADVQNNITTPQVVEEIEKRWCDFKPFRQQVEGIFEDCPIPPEPLEREQQP